MAKTSCCFPLKVSNQSFRTWYKVGKAGMPRSRKSPNNPKDY